MGWAPSWGQLRPLDPAKDPMPCSTFVQSVSKGALRMSDGRWWLCTFRSTNGDVLNAGQGFYPPGPQPKR
jgi:hypothetical protein